MYRMSVSSFLIFFFLSRSSLLVSSHSSLWTRPSSASFFLSCRLPLVLPFTLFNMLPRLLAVRHPSVFNCNATSWLPRCRNHSSVLNRSKQRTHLSFSRTHSSTTAHHSSRHSEGTTWYKFFKVFAAGIAGVSTAWWWQTSNIFGEEHAVSSQDENLFSLQEVTKHNNIEDGVWVTFKGNVYDITEFIAEHPGGDKILLAAGGSLEPFWALYSIHKTQEVFDILAKYRIGRLDPESCELEVDVSLEDPFAQDPPRHPALKVNSSKPFNAEPPLELVVENFLTPTEIFFVRNHLPVPSVNPEEYQLEVEVDGKVTTLTLEDLKTKFPQHKITSTIQCAGNRRHEMLEHKHVKGLEWTGGAISNAEWTGVKLIDVLKYAGLDSTMSAKHVQFEGLDVDIANEPYGASIPAETALNESSDVLLAFDMNGNPLTRDHGYPLRAIVPGTVGARNVKWLGRVALSDEESPSFWQQHDYKGFNPSVDWDTADFSSSPAIQELPVQSKICVPVNNETVKAGSDLILKGYAYSGGGRGINRVDITCNDGQTWQPAELLGAEQPYNKAWAWQLWKAQIKVPDDAESFTVASRAVDSSYNVQPEDIRHIWNIRGVLSNAWSRVNLNVEKENSSKDENP